MKNEHRAPVADAMLGELQAWFFERVTNTGALEPTEPTAAVGREILDGRVPRGERLDIYRHAYVARLVECLADDYPAVKGLLGEQLFEELCRAFVGTHPPQSASLNFYGAPFAAWVEAHSHAWAAFASDLARLEWAMVETIHARAPLALDPEDLGRLSADDWPRVRLVPSPALRILSVRHPLHGAYRRLLAGDRVEPPAPQMTTIAVCRRDDDIWRLTIDPRVAPVLSRLAAGDPLCEALNAASLADSPAENDATAAELRQAFADWASSGFFTRVELA